MIMNLRMIIRWLSDCMQNQSINDKQRIQDICDFLSCQTNSKIALVHDTGEVLFSNSNILAKNCMDTYLNERLKMIMYMQENTTAADLQLKKHNGSLNLNEKYSFYPLFVYKERKASLLSHKEDSFDEWELAALELAAGYLSLLCGQLQNKQEEEINRNLATVKSAIGTLSYTELEAVLLIFAKLQGKDGLIVVSQLADKNNITRSIIVNAVRKLESGGLVETRSLGMKGTHIKIVNESLTSELSKLAQI